MGPRAECIRDTPPPLRHGRHRRRVRRALDGRRRAPWIAEIPPPTTRLAPSSAREEERERGRRVQASSSHFGRLPNGCDETGSRIVPTTADSHADGALSRNPSQAQTPMKILSSEQQQRRWWLVRPSCVQRIAGADPPLWTPSWPQHFT
jgi:hypothetical protein